MEMALPSSVDYTKRIPELPPSTTSSLQSISPNNGTSFGPSQTITYDLPSRSGLYIDGKSVYLKLKLSVTGVTGVAAVRRKPGFTLFSRLDEYIGGTVVNSCSQWNQVSNMLVDINYSAADVLGQAFSWGLTGGATGVVDACGNFDLDGTATAVGANDYYISVPLVGSFLQGMDKLFPTGLAAPIRIQLLTDTIANIFTVAANITSFTISNPELCFTSIDMGYQVDQMIASSTPQLFIKTKGYANGTQGIAAGGGSQISLIYNHRYSSVENFFLLSTTSDVAKGVNGTMDSFNPMGINTAAGTLQLTVGQSNIPQLPIQNTQGGGRAQIQTLLRECTGTILDQRNTMSIGLANYNQFAGNATASDEHGKVAKFIVGFPCSRLNPPNPYQTTALLSGLDCQQSPVTVNLNAGTNFNSAMIFNLIAEYSELIVIDVASKQVSVVN
jgi:hypothetical protein